MDKKHLIVPGSVVQLINAEEMRYKNCFLVVDKVFKWGVAGYIYIPFPERRYPAETNYRANWEEMIYVTRRVEVDSD